ncbi:MAG: TSUP family transporter [Betaproteobacteria bacterium]|nr:TSUP family transporter [Betaproteobacteria bacterium]
MLFAVAVLAVSGLVHGTLGFGFPLISTPVIALVADMQTAIVLTVLPNLAVNLASIARGGRWRASIGRYGFMALWVLLGTLLGTRLLLSVNTAILKLLLAGMIALYLVQDRVKMLDWSVIARHPKWAGVVAGLMAGVLSGAVNVALPPLVIYFMALGLEPLAMTQILNLCFLAGKSTQAASLALGGHFDWQTLQLSLPLALLSVGMLWVGMRLQRNIDPRNYRRLVFLALIVMATLLVAQSLLSIIGAA